MTNPNNNTAEPKYISMPDAALRLGVSAKFIEKNVLAKTNPLPSFKLGRRRLISIEQLDEWMMRHVA
jgi:excisionase family DNA binding protein